jgi:hypothetical protein
MDHSIRPSTWKHKIKPEHLFIAIVVSVVLALVFVWSQRRQGIQEQPLPSSSPTIPTSPIIQPDMTNAQGNSTYLVKVSYRGGLCPPTSPCESNVLIMRDGSVLKDGVLKKTITQQQLESLKFAIVDGDYVTMHKHPFTETCPVVYDGQELVYSFSLNTYEEVLPSCTYDVDDEPLIKFVHTLIDE